MSYCPRFSRVKATFATSYSHDWLAFRVSFPSCLSWRCVNVPFRLKTLGSIKSIHFQGLSFSSSESPDLQGVLCCSQVTFTSRWWVVPSRIQNLSLHPADMYEKEKLYLGNVVHNGIFGMHFQWKFYVGWDIHNKFSLDLAGNCVSYIFIPFTESWLNLCK